MNLGKIYQNFFIAAFSRAVTALIGLVIIGFLTRHLGQEGYGAYTTILAYLFIFSVLADFGLHTIHVREISRYPEKEKLISSNIFTLRIILVFLVMILAVLVSFFLPYSAEIKLGILAATFFIIFSSLSQIVGGVFQKYNTFYLVSFSDIFSRLIQLGLVFWAVKKGLGLLPFIGILSLTSLIQFAVIFYLSRRFIEISLKLNSAYLKNILKISLPVAASILFTAIYIRIDTLMLSLMKSQAEVGIYGLSTKVLETIIFFPALFVELTMPSFSYIAFRTKDLFGQAFKKIFNNLLIFAVPIVVYLIVLAKDIVVILGGKEFTASALPLQILALAVGLIFLGNFGGRTLITVDLQKSAMWIYFSGAVFNIGANLLVIPRYSFLGAAFTTLITEIIVITWMFLLIYKKTKISPEFPKILKPIFAGMIMALAVYQFRESNILIPFLAGLLIYFPLLYLLRGFSKGDLKEIFNV